MYHATRTLYIYIPIVAIKHFTNKPRRCSTQSWMHSINLARRLVCIEKCLVSLTAHRVSLVDAYHPVNSCWLPSSSASSHRGCVSHADDDRALDLRLSWRSPIRCTQKAIIDYRVCGLSGGESPEAGGWCLFFSARTDLDFRRTPRILLSGHVASGVPRRPPAPHAFFASRPPPSIDFVPNIERD